MEGSAPDDLRVALAAIRLAVFDFDGVFTDNTVLVTQDGSESVRCWRGDGIGLQNLRRVGVAPYVLSTEVNPVVTERCAKLDVPVIQACVDKAVQLQALWREGLGDPGCTSYLGNDVNDAGCLQLVRLPAVVADAHPAVADLAVLRTKAAGGRGAVRELCDLIVAARAGTDPFMP